MKRKYNPAYRPKTALGRVLHAGSLALPLFLALGCAEINCPLDNVVVLTAGLYAAEDASPLTLPDTLTVTAAGTDSVLLNRATDIGSFQVPVRQGAETDTLLLRFANTELQTATDTLFVTHTNEPHFESIDCPPSMFHVITSVRWTSHALSQSPLTVDSVAMARPLVNYDDVENIKIYLRSTAR